VDIEDQLEGYESFQKSIFIIIDILYRQALGNVDVMISQMIEMARLIHGTKEKKAIQFYYEDEIAKYAAKALAQSYGTSV